MIVTKVTDETIIVANTTPEERVVLDELGFKQRSGVMTLVGFKDMLSPELAAVLSRLISEGTELLSNQRDLGPLELADILRAKGLLGRKLSRASWRYSVERPTLKC